MADNYRHAIIDKQSLYDPRDWFPRYPNDPRQNLKLVCSRHYSSHTYLCDVLFEISKLTDEKLPLRIKKPPTKSKNGCQSIHFTDITLRDLSFISPCSYISVMSYICSKSCQPQQVIGHQDRRIRQTHRSKRGIHSGKVFKASQH